MKTKILLLISIISIISSKNLRFLDPNNVVDDAQTMINLMKSAGAGGFQGCMGHIGMIIDAYHSIATTFSTTVTNSLKEIRSPSGFSKFQGSIVYDFTLGFRDLGYDFFIHDLLDYIKIPKEYEEQFINTLEESEYVEKNMLSDFTNIYSLKNTTKPKLVSYVNLMIYHYRDRNKNKFDCILTTAQAELDVMGFEFIWHKTKSTAGGIKKVEEDYSEYRPRAFTDKDLQDVIAFFEVASIKELAKLFGVNFDIIL